jgi:hypothetical protein
MKQIFFLFGVSAMTLGANAQQQGAQQHIGDLFGVSVFANNHAGRSEKNIDKAAYSKLSSAFPKWSVSMDSRTGGFKDLNGSPMAVPGSSLEEKARNLMVNQLSAAGINASEWVLSGTQTTVKGISYAYFSQLIAGKAVVFSKMHFRFTADGKIARINMKGYGKPDLALTPSISGSKALETALSDMSGAVVTTSGVADSWEWFPIPSANGYELHPAYKVMAEGRIDQQSSIPLNLFAYVDGVSGELLYRDNETKDAADLHVIGKIYTDGFLNPQRIVGLPYVKGRSGSITLEANDTGFMSSSSLSMPTDIVVSLEGKWSSVKSVPDASAIPMFLTNVAAAGKADSFGNSSTIYSSSRHVNAYYHVNTVHDFMKSQYGSSFTGMDFPLVTNVDATGSCNAFYTAASGGSINFFPANPTCPSYAEVRDVVYHEYGHAIVSKMYTGGMRNGGLNEGQADVWAMGITKDSVMGRGTFWSPTSYIRRYDISPKVYPKDLTGEVHANGEIIAGAWWDYGKNVGSIALMSQLFADVLLSDKPDGPNGTEGEVFYEVLMSALVNDDDDANLSNGTPHFEEIVTAFAKHGIYLLNELDVEHAELAHQAAGKPITVTARIPMVAPNPVFFKSMRLIYRTDRTPGAPWDTLAMTDMGGLNFSAVIPAQSAGTIVDYFFAVTDIVNFEGVYAPQYYYPLSTLPINKVTLNYQFAVGVVPKQVVDFELELPTGWQAGLTSDNATSGVWVWAVPIASSNSGAESQTGKDHTSGSGKCLVTGNMLSSDAYAQSVKSGITTVLTPLYNLREYKNPIVEYYRWYGNFRGRNPKTNIWRVQMGVTVGTLFYKDVENTNQGDYQWRRKLFKPTELFLDPKDMQLRFIASENAVDSRNGLVEAALDDFVIYDAEDVLSIPETSAELATIYPNPASDIIHIILPSARIENVSIEFYDLTGKQINTIPVSKGATHYSIPVQGMVPGQYLVVIKMNKTIQTSKVTVKGE